VTRRARDKHIEVGAAMRQAIRRANAARLSLGEHRTFEAVLALTAGFGRLWDQVYVAEVRELTGVSEATRLHEKTVREHLLDLAERGIIEWEPKRGTDARGRGFQSRLSLPRVEQSGPCRVRSGETSACRGCRLVEATGRLIARWGHSHRREVPLLDSAMVDISDRVVEEGKHLAVGFEVERDPVADGPSPILHARQKCLVDDSVVVGDEVANLNEEIREVEPGWVGKKLEAESALYVCDEIAYGLEREVLDSALDHALEKFIHCGVS
jgi:hypothetical protein